MYSDSIITILSARTSLGSMMIIHSPPGYVDLPSDNFRRTPDKDR